MIKVFPFRGIRYNAAKIGDLSKVVTQPYDKIKDDLMNVYYERHPNNFTRIIKGRTIPVGPTDNVYLRARNHMNDWLKSGILVRDEVPAIYANYQEYTIDGVTRMRKGVSLLVNLREGEVKAHEKTLDAPKADRLNLMWATGSHTEHIFILYPDPNGVVNSILDKTTGSKDPIAEADDDFDCTHRLWAITDKADIKAVQDYLAPHDLFIADGHHRTETSRNYMNAMDLIGLVGEGTETPENCLMTLISMDDPGLIVLPTHRYVHSVAGFDKGKFIEGMMKWFDVELQSPCVRESTLGGCKFFDEKLANARKSGTHTIGVHFKDKTCAILTLRNEKVMDEFASKNEDGSMKSDTWRTLDVTILHTLLLEQLLGIDSAKLAAQTNVNYHRHVKDGLDALDRDPNGQALFVLNATKTEEVRLVANAGERMPQKSTDYFPKLISGMVFSKIKFTGWPGDTDKFYRL